MKGIILSLSCFFLSFYMLSAQTHLYWLDQGMQMINLRTDDGDEIIEQTIVAPHKIKRHIVDPGNQKIYWTDQGIGGVFSVNLDGSEKELIIKELVDPTGIALRNNRLFIAHDGKIDQYKTNGEKVNTVIDSIGEAIDLQIFGNQFYWGSVDSNQIIKADIDGNNKEIIIEASSLRAMEINTITAQLYWASNDEIYRADLSGQNQMYIATANSSLLDLAFEPETNRLYWVDLYSSYVQYVDVDNPSEEHTLYDVILHCPGSSVVYNGYIYYSDIIADGVLFKTQTGQESPVETIAVSDVYNTIHFDFDLLNQKMYWTKRRSFNDEDSSSAILRANLDGTGVEEIISFPNVDRPQDIAVLPQDNQIYWFDKSQPIIYSATLNGENIQEFITLNVPPSNIHTDKGNGNIYWTKDGKVQYTHYSTIDVVDVMGGVNQEVFNISVADEFILWLDYQEKKIGKCELDGSNVNTIIDGSSNTRKPYALTVNNTATEMYYVNNSSSGNSPRLYKYDLINEEQILLIGSYSSSSFSDVYVFDQEQIVATEQQLIKEQIVLLFPNPASDQLVISAKGDVQSVKILDKLGRFITVDYTVNGNIEVDINKLPAGAYWCQVELADNVIIMEAFVKQ